VLFIATVFQSTIGPTGAYLSVSTFVDVPNNDPLVCDRYHVFPS
jgi:hypothetical protein